MWSSPQGKGLYSRISSPNSRGGVLKLAFCLWALQAVLLASDAPAKMPVRPCVLEGNVHLADGKSAHGCRVTVSPAGIELEDYFDRIQTVRSDERAISISVSSRGPTQSPSAGEGPERPFSQKSK